MILSLLLSSFLPVRVHKDFLNLLTLLIGLIISIVMSSSNSNIARIRANKHELSAMSGCSDPIWSNNSPSAIEIVLRSDSSLPRERVRHCFFAVDDALVKEASRFAVSNIAILRDVVESVDDRIKRSVAAGFISCEISWRKIAGTRSRIRRRRGIASDVGVIWDGGLSGSGRGGSCCGC